MGGCSALRGPAASESPLHYARSSTIANFVGDAEPVYRKAHLNIDSPCESAGGGPDFSIPPFLHRRSDLGSRKVFHSTIPGEADYAGCEVASPDAPILGEFETRLGGVAQASSSFLDLTRRVKDVSVEKQRALPTNPDHPNGRSPYLLWWSGRSTTVEARTLLSERK